MASRYASVVLIWPIALPDTGELRTELDAAADGVELVREDDGALVISRGEHVLRIAHATAHASRVIDRARHQRARREHREERRSPAARLTATYRSGTAPRP